jgi:hypothetical protein
MVTGDMNDRRDVFCTLTGRAAMTASNGGAGQGCHAQASEGIDSIFGNQLVESSDHTVDHSQLVQATSDHTFVVTRARVS